MIRFVFLIIFFLPSCAFIDYSQVPNLLKVALVGEDDILIDQKFIDSKQFSFAKVKVGKKYAIMTLLSINDDVYEWISADSEFIYTTKKGEIVKTIGLPYNYNKLNSGLKQKVIELTDPRGLFFQEINSKEIFNDDYVITQERFITDRFKWDGDNTYTVSKKNGLPVKTLQTIHPYLGQIEIYFYFKF